MDARRQSLSVRHPRSRTLSVRLTPEEYREIEEAAGRRGMTKAEYVLWAIEEAEGADAPKGATRPKQTAAPRKPTVGTRARTIRRGSIGR